MSEFERKISPARAAELARALDETTRAMLIAAAPNVLDLRALFATPVAERRR